MLKQLHKFFWPFCIILLFSTQTLWAQLGCGGFNGAPQPSGGPQSVTNGQICLNQAGAPAQITVTATNVADGNNPNNFAVEIDWDDGSPRQIVRFGGPIPVNNTGPHAYTIPIINHVFLPRPCASRPGAECAYRPRVFLRIAGITCPAQFGSSPDFFRFNTDDQCSGDMNFTESVTGANVFEVCAGASTVVTFRDRTILNCLPPQELTGLNSTKRWRRFVYGTTNTITGPVLIGGAAVGFPFTPAGMPVISGEPLNNSAPPFATNTTLTISIPATATVGQEFRIRMDYWNFCNQFPGAAPVSEFGIIRIVDQPTAPTPVDQVICNGTSPLPNFRINFAAASSAVLWYTDVAGAPGAAVGNPNGGNSKNFPGASFPGGITTTTAGVYRMWASYRAQVGAGSLLCESIKVPITITIREPIPTPGPVSGTTPICNGTTGVNFGVPIPASSFPFGGATEYIWEVVDGSNAVVTDVTLTPSSGSNAVAQNITADFNIANGTFGAGTTVTRKVRVRRRYVTPSTFPGAPFSQCTSALAEFSVTVNRNTNAGNIAGGDNKCQGESLTPITWTPGVGNIIRWEVSVNGGPFGTVAPFGTSNPVDPTTLSLPVIGGLPTTYTYRAQIRNGNCAMLATNTILYTINPNTAVANAGPDDAICVPAGTLTYTLAGNAPGGGVTGDWDQISGPGTSIFANQALFNSSVDVTLPGVYVFRWKLDNVTCQSVDDVEIQFGRLPAVPVPTPNDFCGLTGTLTGVAPVGGEIIEWSLVGGPGTAVIANDDLISTSVTVSTFGLYTFQLRFSSGSCAPTTTNVAINFYQAATSTPEADKTVCVDGNVLPAPLAAFPVTGTVGGGASQGRWEITTGTGTFTSTNAVVGSAFAAGTINDNYRPSAADFAAGTVTLRLVAVHPQATCGNVSNTYVITFDKKPADAVVGTAIQVCGTTANLNAVAPTESGVGSWSAITVGPSITDPTDRLSGVTDLEFGANVFRWSINSALGTCTVAPADFTINRTTAPTVVNISPSDLCETVANTGIAQNVDLAANYDDLVKGGVLPTVVVEWFTTAARTPAVAVPNVNNEDVADGEIYYVRVSTTSLPVCSSDGVVNFTINPKPFVSNLNPSMCEEVSGVGEINNVNLTSAAYSGAVAVNAADRTVTWFTDINLTSAVATPADVDNITDGATFYARVENDLTGCFNTAEVVFDVNPIPADNPISGPNTVCLDPAEVIFFKVATLKANHTYQWNIPAAATVIGPTNDFYVLLQFPTVVPGGITIEVQETSPEGCPGTLQQLTITIEDNPGSLAITGPSEVCSNETDVIFTVPLFSNLTYAWSVPPGASIILGQGTEEIHVNFGTIAGDVIVTPSTTVGCVGPTATQPVTINRRPVMAVLNKTVCSQDDAEITLAVAGGSEPATDYHYVSRVLDGGLFILNAGTIPPQNPVADNVLYNDNFENKTGGPLNVRYTVSGISAKGCEGSNSFITLRVNPEPQLDPSLGQAICSDEPTEITLRPAVGSAFADQYIITSITPNGLVNSSPLPLLNTQLTDQAIFNNTWTNTGSSQVDVIYTISAYNSITQCLGQPPTPLTVSVFPDPLITPVGPFTICSEDALSIPLASANVPTATIVWTINQINGNISGATAGNGSAITDLLVNHDAVQGFVEYSVQATNPLALLACEGPSVLVRVFVDPKPSVNNIAGKKCSDAVGGNIFTESLTSLEPSISSSSNISFVWYKDLLLTLPMTPAEVAAYPLQNGVKVYAEVTNTVSGCSQVASVEYEVTPNVGLALTTLNRNGYNLFCANDNSGQLTTVVAGGTSPYTYSVNGGPLISSNGNYTFNTLPGSILQTVTVIDKNGCTTNDSKTLLEPPPLGGGVNILQEISCFLEKDGIIEAVATGGTGTYTYLLIQTNTSNATGLFPNLGDGDYSVRISDNNGCTFDTAPLKQLRQPTQVTLDADVTAELGCKDALDGQIDVLATGGTPTYTYTLVRSGDPVNPFQVSATGPFQNLPFGSYTVIARDQNNCPSPTVALKIDNPPVFNPGRIGDDQSICLGATPSKIVELVPAFGGVGNYTYSWEASFTGLANDWTDIGHSGKEFQPNILPDTTYYRRTVTSGTCPPLTSAVVKIYVNPLPRVTFTSPLDVCQGDGFFLQVNLLEGTAPIEYDYSAGSTTFTNLTGLSPTNIPVSNFQENTRYTLERVKDFNGCLSPDVPLSLDVKLIRINSDFEVLAPDAQCSGGTFSFQWMVEDGIKYTWEWTDGTQTIVNNPLSAGPDDRPLGLQTITHIFAGGSTEDSTVYPVRLWAQNALCDAQYTIKDVTVFPNIILNILPGDLALCSGESTRFRDQSVGVDAGTWYYRVKGTTDRSEERAGPVPIMEYQLTNTTTTNPIIYEVIYEATNDEGCTDQYMQEIKVYRGVTASIIASPDPQNDFIGGVSTVTFTNNSNPLDAADFDYTWDFDDIKASPPNGTGTGNFVVSYFSADSRNVILKAINKTARIDGKTCESIDIKPIMIRLPLLDAKFKATPLASCFPTDITVQNLSPGADTFAWELFNQSGLVATSNLANPVFRILAPGTYDIFLKASYLATGQEAEAKQLGIEVFDRPSALFELRPNPLYVPDTEMQTFNKSLRANLYEWNFDDGGTSNEFEPRYFYKLEGKYKVMLVAGFDNGNKDIDGDGILDGNVICYDTTRQDLVALDGGYIKLPNAFTPSPTGPSGGVSGNGTFNDVFLPIMRGVEEFQMQIFDRWGTLIFQTKDKDIGWDGYDRNGTAMPAGVYVYKLVMRLSDGQRTTKIGDVTLIK